MARIAILLVDQPLEDAVVAWVEWDEAIKAAQTKLFKELKDIEDPHK